MSGVDIYDHSAIVARLKAQAKADAFRITAHGHQEMAEEGVFLADVMDVLLDAKVLENYPLHKRGACCLVCRQTPGVRPLHVVCTTALDIAIVITVYEPKMPRWKNPLQRGTKL